MTEQDLVAIEERCAALVAAAAGDDDRSRVAFRMWWREMLEHHRTREERDHLRAILRRYTDLVELSAEDYRARYGPIADYADALDEFYQAARAALGADGSAG